MFKTKIMINTLQAEIAKDLINNNDATIQGVLLGVIVILIVAIGILWKSREAKEAYIREQDKANLELLINITNTVKNVGETSKTNSNKLDDIKLKANSILDLIRQRFNGYK